MYIHVIKNDLSYTERKSPQVIGGTEIPESLNKDVVFAIFLEPRKRELRISPSLCLYFFAVYFGGNGEAFSSVEAVFYRRCDWIWTRAHIRWLLLYK